MAVNFFEKPTYTLFINSADKISGTTNNNATFQINWNDFLPRDYQMYKMAFNFQTTGGNYKDGSYTTTASTSATSLTLSNASYPLIKSGLTVSGTGVSGNPTVTSIIGNTVVLSSNQSIAGATTLTFTTTGIISNYYIELSAPNTSITTGMTATGTGITGGTTVTNITGNVSIQLSTSESAQDGQTITFTTNATTNGAVSNNTLVNIVTANSSIAVGQVVSGTGISGNPTVASVLGTIVTLSSTQTISTGTVLTFTTTATVSTTMAILSTNNSLIQSGMSITGTNVTGTPTVSTISNVTIGGNTVNLFTFSSAQGSTLATGTVLTFSTTGTMASVTNFSLGTLTPAILPGATVSGSGITGSPTVLSISGTSIVLSSAQPLGTNQSLTFSSVYIFSSAKVSMNTLGRSFSFDTATKSPSIALGVIQRDIQISGTASNTLSCYYLYNPPKTISRPNQNLITVSIYNQATGLLLTDTNSAGNALASDMTSWTGCFEFIPIEGSKAKTQPY